MCKKLKKIRLSKFREQGGRCYYCDRQMWEVQVGSGGGQRSYLICTAEHLIARQDGGPDAGENIVAACKWCNTRRHMRSVPLGPAAYKDHVQRRMKRGKWHPQPTSFGHRVTCME